jgi:hypothetical protein
MDGMSDNSNQNPQLGIAADHAAFGGIALSLFLAPHVG